MARAYVWFVPEDIAVYFEAHDAAQAWAIAQKKKKEWALGGLPHGQDSAVYQYGQDGRDEWFEGFPRRRLGCPWPPGVVKQTPKGTLYTYSPNSTPFPFVRREKWTLIETNGRKKWIEIDDGPNGTRVARNSERQRFEESVDASNERRNQLARDGWQRVTVK